MLRNMFLVLGGFLILAVAAALWLNYTYHSMLEPVDPDAVEEYILIEISTGSDTESIAALLFKEGLIQNELAFRIYARRQGDGQALIAGSYNLSPSMPVTDIYAAIRDGLIYVETAWFTIPEGFTVEQIAARLAEEGLAEEEAFLALAREPTAELVAEFPFLNDLDNQEIIFILEGYLYPDTYEVYTSAGEIDLARIMLRRMNQVLNDLDYRQHAVVMGLSLHEILTVASLVEREVRVDHERKTVAGVIHNRLEIDQLLQIDATIQYILGETKEFLTYADLELPSPYNTYLHAGLPPGPIAAPGKPSIAAALEPEKTDYYFYNYKYDGSGEHYFSKTYAEHLQNVRVAEENLE